MIVFYISRLAPGDPLVSYYGERVEKMSPEEHDWAMEKLGLNESVSVQYVKWLSNAFHGEFGISYKYKMDVLEVISARVGNREEKTNGFSPVKNRWETVCFFRALFILFFTAILKKKNNQY